MGNHKATADAASKIDFNGSYAGNHKMDIGIKWDFGDGIVQQGNCHHPLAARTYQKHVIIFYMLFLLLYMFM